MGAERLGMGNREWGMVKASAVPPGQRQRSSHSRQTGFTLLEVLIALLILSLVLVALIRTAGLQAQAFNHHRDSTLAQWVASNVAAELRAEGPPELGRQQGQAQMGQQRWRWQAEVVNTDVDSLRRIDISVFADDPEQGLTVGEGDPVARLTAFAGR